MLERITVGVIADDTELRKWAERLADANVHGPAAVLFHAADGVNAIADTVEKLTAEVEALRGALATVFAHIDQRPEYVTALRNSTDTTNGDYGRWSGHAEARRQLAEALDMTVPYEHGETTQPKENPDA